MIDIDSTLIKFDSDKPKTYEDHLENIEELLKSMLIRINCLSVFLSLWVLSLFNAEGL